MLKHIKLFSSFLTILLLIAVWNFTACKGKGIEGKERKESVQASLAPLDIFPHGPTPSIRVRFSHSITSVVDGEDLVPDVTITPPTPGQWRFSGDSEMVFQPTNFLPPETFYQVFLEKLRVRSPLTLITKSLLFKTPKPKSGISKCELSVTSKDPVIKAFTVKLHFNYPLIPPSDSVTEQPRVVLSRYTSAVKVSNNKEQPVPLTVTPDANGLAFLIRGSDMLRPEEPGKISFKLRDGLPTLHSNKFPGNECQLDFQPLEWRTELSGSLTDSNSKNAPQNVELFLDTEIAEGGSLLYLKFQAPSSSSEISHKRPVDSLIKSGLKVTRQINGEEVTGNWKATTNSQFIFESEAQFAPGEIISVTVDPKEFPELKFQQNSLTKVTPLLAGDFQELTYGIDPNTPSERSALSDLLFNYPVTPESLLEKVRVTLEDYGVPTSKKEIPSFVEATNFPGKLRVRSSAIALKDVPQEVTFSLKGKVLSSIGGEARELKSTLTSTLPSRREVFTVQGVSQGIAKSPNEELQRILNLSVSEDADENELQKNLAVRLLPDCRKDPRDKVCDDFYEAFSHQGEVTKPIEEASLPLQLTFVSKSDDSSGGKLFSYAFQAPGDRQIFVKLAEGTKSKLDFPLGETYREVAHLAEFPKRLEIMLDGALLSLSGQREIGILAQNMQRIRARLSRVKATDLHHLVYLNQSGFKDPVLGKKFNFDNLSDPIEFVKELYEAPNGKPSYTSIDFRRFMNSSTVPQGLFFLELKEELPTEGLQSNSSSYYEDEESDDENEKIAGTDSRLILLTDLGLIVKRGRLGDSQGDDTVYLASFQKGEPVGNATVNLVARNGSVLFSRTTDANGMAVFPNASSFLREKEPLLYTAQLGDDLTYLPYQASDRSINFSRFNIGGVYNSEDPNALRALMFTDRGIYKPGEEIKFALTVRKRDFKTLPESLPLIFRIFDPSEQKVFEQIVNFPKLGLSEILYRSLETKSTGTYRAALFVPSNKDSYEPQLSSINFRIEDFEPDKLRISSSFKNEGREAVSESSSNIDSNFVPITNLSGGVKLTNLFGLPAEGHKVTGVMQLTKWSGFLGKFPEYRFLPYDQSNTATSPRVDLGERVTSANGEADFPIKIDGLSGYVVNAVIAFDGFEKESGRSVATSTNALVTDLNYLLGVKANDSLDYVNIDAKRNLSLLAISINKEPIEFKGVRVELEKKEYSNILVKQSNGLFNYESNLQLMPISKQNIEISKQGSDFLLDTSKPGEYRLTLYDGSNQKLNSVDYSIVGEGNDAVKIDRNATLEVKLDKESYFRKDQIKLAIRAPYTGFGLITIEREGVLATSWFKTDTNISTQIVDLPDEVSGNAYVTVMLVRDGSSKEIYMSPLSFATVPIKVAEEEYLRAPSLYFTKSVLQPGAVAQLKYNTTEDGLLIIYGVDEGILQFGKYKSPAPLAALLPKRALEVDTRTALDLILPDYQLVKMVMSPGGDEDTDLSKYQNPFKKRNRPPVAYWSGVQKIAPGEGEFTFAVPDHFDGAIRFFAYFVSESFVGINEKEIEVRGDFVIRPNLPSFIAPNDEFELPVEVVNTLKVPQRVEVNVSSDGLELSSSETSKPNITIEPGLSQVVKLTAKTKNTLGPTPVVISVKGSATDKSTHERKLTDEIGIRPANPLMRTVSFGAYDSEKPGDIPERELPNLRDMYPHFRESKAYISNTPAIFIDSLHQYMERYPYGCTEQLTSKAFVKLALLNLTEDEVLRATLTAELKNTVNQLISRLNGDGSFGLWERGEQVSPFASIYATHLILELREAGFSTPPWSINAINGYLTTKSKEQVIDLTGLFDQAYAIYLRTKLRDSQVVELTTQLNSLAGKLKFVQGSWQGSAINYLVASSYKVLNLNKEASEFIAPTGEANFSSLPFPQNLPSFNSGLIFLLKQRHFSDKGQSYLAKKDMQFAVLNRLITESLDSLSVGGLILPFIDKDFWRQYRSDLSNNTIFKLATEKGPLALFGDLVKFADVPLGSTKLFFSGKDDSNNNLSHFYYSHVESGYDVLPSAQGKRTAGLSISRDLVDASGASISEVTLGGKYKVNVRLRAETDLTDIALQDLLPSGFELELDELRSTRLPVGDPKTWQTENIDIRDDRIILFGDLMMSQDVLFSYTVKPTVRGKFVWPGVYAEAMYNPKQYAWDKASTITVK
jgi:hypothetical protein